MAVTTDPFNNIDLQYSILELWPGLIHEAKFPEITLLNWAVDLSEYMTEGGDIVNVPEIYTNQFTVQTQTTQGAEVTTESVAQGNNQLNVDTHKYIAFLIGDKDMKQLARKYSLNERYARECKELLTGAIEDGLFGLYGSITNTGGNAAGAMTDLHIRQAINTMEAGSFRLSEIALFVHNDVYWNQLIAYQKYYDRSQSGGNVVRSGNFGNMNELSAYRGEIYSVPLYVTNRVATATNVSKNLLLHKEAMAFASQTLSDGMIRVRSDYLLQNMALLTVVDVIYGVAVLRAGAGVMIEALNTTTVS